MSDQFKQKVVTMAKSGQRKEALKYAKQYIREHPDDLDAWWFVATLVKNSKVRRQCCEHILEVNPFHAEAQAMLDELNAAERPPTQQPKAAPFSAEPAASPFTQSPPPAEDMFANPLGMSSGGSSSGANPIGIPSVDEFFDDASSSANPFANKTGAGLDDLRPLGMKMKMDDLSKPSKKQSKGLLDDNTAFAIVAVLGIVTVLCIIGAIAVYVTQDFEKSTIELNQTASNESFALSYSADWEVNHYENDRMVVVNRPLVNTDDIDPWANFSQGMGAIYPSEAFWNFVISIEDKAAGKELFVAIMQPIPQQADYIIDNMISETKELYEGDLFVYSIKLDDEDSIVTIDTVNSEFTSLNAKIRLLGSTITIESYFVYVIKDEQHYLFTVMVYEPKQDNWEAVARDMAESIDLPPLNTPTPMP